MRWGLGSPYTAHFCTANFYICFLRGSCLYRRICGPCLGHAIQLLLFFTRRPRYSGRQSSRGRSVSDNDGRCVETAGTQSAWADDSYPCIPPLSQKPWLVHRRKQRLRIEFLSDRCRHNDRNADVWNALCRGCKASSWRFGIHKSAFTSSPKRCSSGRPPLYRWSEQNNLFAMNQHELRLRGFGGADYASRLFEIAVPAWTRDPVPRHAENQARYRTGSQPWSLSTCEQAKLESCKHKSPIFCVDLVL